jgi:hypothetical protein
MVFMKIQQTKVLRLMQDVSEVQEVRDTQEVYIESMRSKVKAARPAAQITRPFSITVSAPAWLVIQRLFS